MSWLATDKDGEEYIYDSKPIREGNIWITEGLYDNVNKLPEGSIEKLIGKKLTWDDEPYEILSESEELERMERN